MLYPLQTFASGMVLGFSIAAPPGPINATAAFQVSTRSWLAGWLTELGATTVDGFFFILTYYGLTTLVASSSLRMAIFLVGGVLMVYLAYSTFRRVRKRLLIRGRGDGRFPYLIGLSIAITNPYQLAWWVTVGVGMVTTFGASILGGFFAGILVWTVAYTSALHVSIVRYERIYPIVVASSGAILAAFGVWFLVTALSSLL